jgi:hypothetical protein
VICAVKNARVAELLQDMVSSYLKESRLTRYGILRDFVQRYTKEIIVTEESVLCGDHAQ